MSENQTVHPDTHCISATKVFDWTFHCSTIRMKIPIFIKRKIIIHQEKICGDFYIKHTEQESTLLWENSSTFNTTGTIWLSNNSKGNGIINIFVNNKFLFSIPNNKSRSITIDKFQSLSITANSIYDCQGHFFITVNKKIKLSGTEKLNIKGIKKAECFFTDQYDNSINSCSKESIEYKKTMRVSGRKDIEIILPNGKTVLLQKVKLRKKGYLSIELYDDNHCIEPVPFSFEEDFLLCAPTGTVIACTIEKANCYVNLIPKSYEDICFEVEISIDIQQIIEVLAKENILIRGNLIYYQQK
ncbi:DUF3992 domain-containing protein [Priestia megaterium]|uniref:DUF3992 domain-containing protein n=1 Tax=Priestia megaterium TaxID=1404 RepID=UPI001A950CAF|nr:S-Ena type endospore appendage [Priestia megaterium]QSX24527.1 DUF3992 domain-containing protein [Priestia megaterium]